MLYFSDDFELWGNELGGCFDGNENEVDDHRGKCRWGWGGGGG